jgi:large subunit ribosomal protein L35
MPKLKTKSGAKKRFQVKKGGAVKFRRAGVRHLATFGKTKKQKRHLRGTDHLAPMDGKKIKENFPYAR